MSPKIRPMKMSKKRSTKITPETKISVGRIQQIPKFKKKLDNGSKKTSIINALNINITKTKKKSIGNQNEQRRAAKLGINLQPKTEGYKKTEEFRAQLKRKNKEIKANPKQALKILEQDNAEKVVSIDTKEQNVIRLNANKIEELTKNNKSEFKLTSEQKGVNGYVDVMDSTIKSTEEQKPITDAVGRIRNLSGDTEHIGANIGNIGSKNKTTPFQEFMKELDSNMKSVGLIITVKIGDTNIILDYTELKTNIKNFVTDYVDMFNIYFISSKDKRGIIKFNDEFIKKYDLDKDSKIFNSIIPTNLKEKIRRTVEAKHLKLIIRPIIANIKQRLKNIDTVVKQALNKKEGDQDRLKILETKKKVVNDINKLLDEHRKTIFSKEKVIFTGGSMKRSTRASTKASSTKASTGTPSKTSETQKKTDAEIAAKKEQTKQKLDDSGAGKLGLPDEVVNKVIQSQEELNKTINGSDLPHEVKKKIITNFKTKMGEIDPSKDLGATQSKVEEVQRVMGEVNELINKSGAPNTKNPDIAESVNKSIQECLEDPTKTVKSNFEMIEIKKGRIPDMKVAEAKLIESIKTIQETTKKYEDVKTDAAEKIAEIIKNTDDNIDRTKSETLREIEAVKPPKFGSITTKFFNFFGINPDKVSEGLHKKKIKDVKNKGVKAIAKENAESRKLKNIQTIEINKATAAMTLVKKQQMKTINKDVAADIKIMGGNKSDTSQKYKNSREALQIEINNIKKLSDVEPDIKNTFIKQLENQVEVLDKKIETVDKKIKTVDKKKKTVDKPKTLSNNNLTIKKRKIMPRRSKRLQRDTIKKEVKKVFDTQSLPNNVKSMINKLNVGDTLNTSKISELSKSMKSHKEKETVNKIENNKKQNRTLKKHGIFSLTSSASRKKERQNIANKTKKQLNIKTLPKKVNNMIRKLKPGNTLDLEKVTKSIEDERQNYVKKTMEGLKKHYGLSKLPNNVVKKIEKIKTGEIINIRDKKIINIGDNSKNIIVKQPENNVKKNKSSDSIQSNLDKVSGNLTDMFARRESGNATNANRTHSEIEEIKISKKKEAERQIRLNSLKRSRQKTRDTRAKNKMKKIMTEVSEVNNYYKNTKNTARQKNIGTELANIHKTEDPKMRMNKYKELHTKIMNYKSEDKAKLDNPQKPNESKKMTDSALMFN